MKKLYIIGLILSIGANLAACDKDNCPHGESTGPIIPERIIPETPEAKD